MFTQCPECGTIFRVTAAVLRTARGQVRCGVCDATFDALEYLTEDVEVDPVTGAAIATDAAGPVAASHLPPHSAASPAYVPDAPDPGHPAPAPHVDDAEPIEVSVELGRVDPSRLPPPEFPPFDDPAAADAPAADAPLFERRAGRTTPSADEDRALAEIAASIARNAQPLNQRVAAANAVVANAAAADAAVDAPVSAATPAGTTRPADADLSIEVELLDPADAENIVLAGDAPTEAVELVDATLDEVPDAALEFDASTADWDSVFVEDRNAPTIPPLDPTLARARAEALATPPDSRTGRGTDGESEFESARLVDAEHGEDLEIELEALGDLDEDDGESDEEPPRPRRRAPAAPELLDAEALESAPPRGEDPLSRTDEFPPLRISAEEEAALGLGPTPARAEDPAPRPAAAAPAAGTATDLPPPPPGVRPEDFDALVAAAAARAAAAVAAVVAVPPGTAATSATGTAGAAGTPGTVGAAGTADLDAPSPPDLAVRGSAAGTDRQDDGLEWRRDLAPASARADDETPEFVQFDPSRFQTVAGARSARPWWVTAMLGLGALVLAGALAAQLVHYRRDDLAQHPVAGPPLRDLYARLGLPIEPTWSLSAYELKQWGAGADSEPGTLRVRASVVNRAGRAQPYPLIRVTLEDRFGGKVARREFTPGEYLPTREAPPQLLASNARVDADLVLADPGSEAVGFELDVCLPRRGALVCAEDLKLAQAP